MKTTTFTTSSSGEGAVSVWELVRLPQWPALLAALNALPADISAEGFCAGYKTILDRLADIPAEDVAAEYYRECRAAMRRAQ